MAAYRAPDGSVSLTETEVVPGVPEALAALGAVATLAVVTSKPPVFTVPVLDGLGLLGRFAAAHGPDLETGPSRGP